MLYWPIILDTVCTVLSRLFPINKQKRSACQLIMDRHPLVNGTVLPPVQDHSYPGSAYIACYWSNCKHTIDPMCMCLCVCCACPCVCLCVYVPVSAYTHTHTHRCTHRCTCTCTLTCIYPCTYRVFFKLYSF